MYSKNQAFKISVDFIQSVEEEKAKSIKVMLDKLQFDYIKLDGYFFDICACVTSGTGILTAMNKYQYDFIHIDDDANRCVNLNADIKRIKNLLTFWYPDASDIAESEKLVSKGFKGTVNKHGMDVEYE